MSQHVALSGLGRVSTRQGCDAYRPGQADRRLRLCATFLLAIGFGGALAGCSLSPNIGLKKGIGLRGVTEADLKPPQRVAPANRYQDVEIRTEIRRSGVNISGAVCTARSTAVSLDFKTPGRIALPLLEEATPPLTIRCEHEKQGVARVVLRTGVAPRAESLLEEILGPEAPERGRYLPRYTLQLVKSKPNMQDSLPPQPEEALAPPNALSAAMEASPVWSPVAAPGREWPEVYPGSPPRPRPKRL